MLQSSDNLNCLKNLMQLMCCDGRIHKAEKSFLARTASELKVDVDDWNALLREVLKDDVPIYPIRERDKATATLKSLIVMSKVDGKVDSEEKSLTLQFAKSIGITKAEWKHILKNINLENLFEPFRQIEGEVIVITDDFSRLDAFRNVAVDNGATVKTVELRRFLNKSEASGKVICFHAAEDKDVTLTQCQMLLDKCGDKLVCILTRYQGYQVKYLLEIGLKKCIIEPVYAHDITNLFKINP